MKRSLLLIAVLVIAVIAWAYISPRLAAKRFHDAALAGDMNTLNAVVDFPAVRAHLITDLKAGVAQRAASSNRNSPLGAALGASAVGLVAQGLVDRLVSARGIANLARYGGSDSSSSVQVQLLGMGYQDLSDFAIAMGKPGRARDTVTFVFHRSGLTWRLARLEIPGLTRQ